MGRGCARPSLVPLVGRRCYTDEGKYLSQTEQNCTLHWRGVGFSVPVECTLHRGLCGFQRVWGFGGRVIAPEWVIHSSPL